MTAVRFLFITANVGSLFEEAAKLQVGWMNEILKLIQKSRPLFIALHLQEVGGKDFEKCMDQVIGFIDNFYTKCCELGFTNGRCYIDDDFESNDKFTALGSLYLMHKDLSNVCVYNFQTSNFEPVSNFKLFTKILDNETTMKRQRFPKTMFPLFKWSRKGFMRTRWKIHQKVFNFVNIHLFHDACNFVAAEQSPSVYSSHRKQALQYALNIVEERDISSPIPTFIFGDFNFRLDTRSLVENLTPATEQTSIKDAGQRLINMEYRNEASSECILRIGSKLFEHSNHENLSQMNLVEFDKELLQFPELKEMRKSFPPSYPFCEDVAHPTSYMKTRPPAWCDRILMNSQAWNMILASPNKAATDYNLLGRNICMGDHKPVYLLTEISLNETDSGSSAANNVDEKH